jgi:hypothetical protein
MCAIFWLTKASATSCGAPSSCTSSAPIAPSPKILAPTRLDIAQEFACGFDGMTDTPVTIDSLLQACEQRIAEIVGKMPGDHKQFLHSLMPGRSFAAWVRCAKFALAAKIEVF